MNETIYYDIFNKGFLGGMVLLPVPTEGTFEHVADTLPSCASLIISVTCSGTAAPKLVCLPRVLKALRWLKENNVHYANITINNAFTFDEDVVSFTGQREKATTEQLANLITDDEANPTLLKHDDVDKSIMRPLHAEPTKGTGLEKYLLVKVSTHKINYQNNSL